MAETDVLVRLSCSSCSGDLEYRRASDVATCSSCGRKYLVVLGDRGTEVVSLAVRGDVERAALELGLRQLAAQAMGEVDRLRQQRDELNAALIEFRETLEHGRENEEAALSHREQELAAELSQGARAARRRVVISAALGLLALFGEIPMVRYFVVPNVESALRGFSVAVKSGEGAIVGVPMSLVACLLLVPILIIAVLLPMLPLGLIGRLRARTRAERERRAETRSALAEVGSLRATAERRWTARAADASSRAARATADLEGTMRRLQRQVERTAAIQQALGALAS